MNKSVAEVSEFWLKQTGKVAIASEALDSLKRMVEELERDAARYRYIAAACEIHTPDGKVFEDECELDAAMKQE